MNTDREKAVVYSLGYADTGMLLTEWSIQDQGLVQRREQAVFQDVGILPDTLTLIPAPEPLLVAWAEGDGRDTLLVWSRGAISQRLEGIPPATAFVELQDGTLISAHDHGPLRSWKRFSRNGKIQLQPTGLIEVGITALSLTSFNLNNQEILVAGGVDGSLVVMRAGKPIQKIGPAQTAQSRLVSLTALPSGEVISGDDQSGIRWWKWQNSHAGEARLVPASPRVFSTGQVAIQSLVAMSLQQLPNGIVLSAGTDGSLRMLGHEPYALAQSLRPSQAVAASPGGISALTAWRQGDIASAYQDGSICWWGSLADIQSIPTPRCTQTGAGATSTALVALDEEHQLISAGTDGYLRWWNKEQTIVKKSELNRSGAASAAVQAMVLLNNSDLVTGDVTGALQWWTTRGQRKGSTIPSGENSVNQLIALDNNDVVSLGGLPEKLHWWSNGKMRAFSQKTIQQSRLSSISRWSGREVMTGDESGLIQRWSDGKRMDDPVKTDHPSGVWAMLKLRRLPLQPDVLLTAGDDGRIGVWNSGFKARERGVQPKHETINTGQAKITALLETNSGDLISGSEDGSVKFTSPSKVVKAACQLYKPLMDQPSSAAEHQAAGLCSCPPPDHWWNLLQWLCFGWNLIS